MKSLFLSALFVLVVGCNSQTVSEQDAEQMGRDAYRAYREGVAKEMGFESAEEMDRQLEKLDDDSLFK